MFITTNVEAHAVRTIDWLSAPDTTLAVPVYQRQYRWDINGCRRLLDDIRAVAGKDEWQTHFIGSILATQSRNAGLTELGLIDGQQRVSTLTLARRRAPSDRGAVGPGPRRATQDHLQAACLTA